MILIGVAAFIVLMVAIGLWVARKVQGDSTNYIVAGRGLILPLAAFDGLPTFISPLLGLFTFVVLALATQDTYEPAVKDVKALVTEDGPVAEPVS